MSFKFLFAKIKKKYIKERLKNENQKKKQKTIRETRKTLLYLLYMMAISSVSVMKINKNEYDKEKWKINSWLN